MMTARQLQTVAETLEQDATPLLDYLLEVADSSLTYRSRYHSGVQQAAVLDVLWLDESNPRSLMFQMSHLAELYGKLSRQPSQDWQAIRYAARRVSSLDAKHIHSGEAARALRELRELLVSWSANLSNTYFSHARTLPITIGA